MPLTTNQTIGQQKNKLLRYQTILDYYLEIKNPDIPVSVVWRNYIYPKFHISRVTLYNILGTPIKKELKQLEAIQPSLFD